MKKIMKTLLLSILCLLILQQVMPQDPKNNMVQRVETNDYILQITEVKSPHISQIIRKLPSAGPRWWKGPSTFEIRDSSSEFHAIGWISSTSVDLLFHVEVTDDKNFNAQTFGDDIWKDDCVQVAIDAQGQGSGEMPPETRGMVGDDDCSFGMALTASGPVANAWFWSGGNYYGVMPKDFLTIQRNEKKKLTVYDMRIPWATLHTVPGMYPSLGIAIQINDRDDPGADQRRFYWGRGADAEPRPGLFNRLAPEPPLSGFTASATINQTLWNRTDTLSCLYSLSGTTGEFLLNARYDKSVVNKIITLKSLEPVRYSVQLIAKSSHLTGTSISSLTDMNTRKVVAEHHDSIVNPQSVYDNFISLMDSLILIPDQHPLFLRHLMSVKALTASEWAKIDFLKANNPKLRDETFGYVDNLYNGFKGGSSVWENYTGLRRSLLMAYISRIDRTVQYYLLDLPKDWDPEKIYPLFVELHGAGNSSVLNIPSAQLGSGSTAPDLMGYSKSRSFSQTYGMGYHIAPWGRGNLSYRDIGEQDVYEAINDIEKNFNIDQNRKYLYGFSMGGGGTWSIGLRTPDQWAAIGIYAGGVWRERDRPENLTSNVASLPVFIEVGEKDGLLASYKVMLSELQKSGTQVYPVIVPGIGHQFLDSLQMVGLNWMTQFVRKRPDKFFYIADTREHTGVWGISMIRNEGISARPWFDCEIKGQTIDINSSGTERLIIDPGMDGLQMEGDIKIIWNGKLAYEGKNERVTLRK